MTKFEEQLIDKGYLTHTFNCSTNKYERGRKAISTMTNLDNRYINKDTEKEMTLDDRRELQQKLQTLRESREYYEKDDRLPVPQNNPYYQVSLICLFLFIIIMSYKIFNKK